MFAGATPEKGDFFSNIHILSPIKSNGNWEKKHLPNLEEKQKVSADPGT